MSSWSVRALRRVASDLRSFQDGRMALEAVDTFVITLELVYRELIAREQLDGFNADVAEACDFVTQSLNFLRRYQHEQLPTHESHIPPLLHTGCVGRPKFEIPCAQIEYLIENRFTAPQIAQMLGVSLSTIRRRMALYGLSIRAEYAQISDDELDAMITDISLEFPMCGNRQMQGHLLSHGFRVQQQRIRDAQRRVDPEGSIMRRLHAVNRRQYCVPAPLSLWHIDGNHKLIRCNDYVEGRGLQNVYLLYDFYLSYI